MRKDLLIGVALVAAPIIAIAQTAPTPPDEPVANAQSDDDRAPADEAEEPANNSTVDGDAPAPEPEAPQT